MGDNGSQSQLLFMWRRSSCCTIAILLWVRTAIGQHPPSHDNCPSAHYWPYQNLFLSSQDGLWMNDSAAWFLKHKFSHMQLGPNSNSNILTSFLLYLEFLLNIILSSVLENNESCYMSLLKLNPVYGGPKKYLDT